jgi:hypothetical protein
VLATSYTSGQICVRGVDMADLSSIHLVTEPTTITRATKSIEIAELRYEVSELLKQPTQDRANTLLTRLRNLPYASENIVQMMIEDCETVLETLQRGLNHQVQAEMAQHSAYLGLGRGLRCAPTASATAEPPRYWGIQPHSTEPTDPVPSARTARVDYSSSPFSNQTQQVSVNLMRSRTRPENT